MREFWRYDERNGMVAVYAGEKRNCLVTNEPFIFSAHFERDGNGGFVRDEKACATAKLLATLNNDLAIEEAAIQTVIALIGGTDSQGNPTSRVNYLQRLRQLIRSEKRANHLGEAMGQICLIVRQDFINGQEE